VIKTSNILFLNSEKTFIPRLEEAFKNLESDSINDKYMQDENGRSLKQTPFKNNFKNLKFNTKFQTIFKYTRG